GLDIRTAATTARLRLNTTLTTHLHSLATTGDNLRDRLDTPRPATTGTPPPPRTAPDNHTLRRDDAPTTRPPGGRDWPDLTSRGPGAPDYTTPPGDHPDYNSSGETRTNTVTEAVRHVWRDPERRSDWYRAWTSDPANRVPITVDDDARRFQVEHLGDTEFRLRASNGQAVIADGLQLDSDSVVAAEAKFVRSPGASMHEGSAPSFIQQRLMQQFDDEMLRYKAVIDDPTNPVSRLRILTNTEAAATYLNLRVNQLFGPGYDVDIRVVSGP
ncbi:MAG: restriction endonuclease fold toxin-2 domain-containing protein, partial [Dermatophilaceae bacterium]